MKPMSKAFNWESRIDNEKTMKTLSLPLGTDKDGQEQSMTLAHNIFISGVNGCGKTVLMLEWIRHIRQANRKTKIIFFDYKSILGSLRDKVFMYASEKNYHACAKYIVKEYKRRQKLSVIRENIVIFVDCYDPMNKWLVDVLTIIGKSCTLYGIYFVISVQNTRIMNRSLITSDYFRTCLFFRQSSISQLSSILKFVKFPLEMFLSQKTGEFVLINENGINQYKAPQIEEGNAYAI